MPLLLLANQLPWFSGELGWLDSYRVQIIPFIANAFSVYLFYQFFTLPTLLLHHVGNFVKFHLILSPKSPPWDFFR